MNNRVRHGSSAFRSLAAGVIGWIVAAVLFAWGNPPAEAGGMPYALFEGLPVLMKFLNETKRPRRDLKTGRVVKEEDFSPSEAGLIGPEPGLEETVSQSLSVTEVVRVLFPHDSTEVEVSLFLVSIGRNPPPRRPLFQTASGVL